LLLLGLVPKLFNEDILAILPKSSFPMIEDISANYLSLRPKKTGLNNIRDKPKDNYLLLKFLS